MRVATQSPKTNFCPDGSEIRNSPSAEKREERALLSPDEHFALLPRVLRSVGMSFKQRRHSMPTLSVLAPSSVGRLHYEDVAPRTAGEGSSLDLILDDDAESTSTESAQDVAVQVFLRVRADPRASAAQPVLRVLPPEPSKPGARVEIDGKTFKFNAAGGEGTTQAELFACVGQPICCSVMNGYNGTVFAYGQTGSGKTRE